MTTLLNSIEELRSEVLAKNEEAVAKVEKKVTGMTAMRVALGMLKEVKFSSVSDAYNLPDNAREVDADGKMVVPFITRKTLYAVWEALKGFGYTFADAPAVAINREDGNVIAVYEKCKKEGVVSMGEAIVRLPASFLAKNEAIIQAYVDDIAKANRLINKARKDGKSEYIVKD